MSDTTTANTLARNLRLAADLCDQLGWDQGITWSGIDTLGLHAHDDDEWAGLVIATCMTGAEVGPTRLHRDGDVTFTATHFTTADGLRVTLYGPRIPLTEDGGAA